ncbi:salivary peroxidase/catechol oxidase-like isoform X2 [Littorina saxatilis]|uniref:salivary peroxidase/catechol oxidase-like isoform X2 n=1 Tax=Littorina saxatilis TaxID=31220 RepID=UPI0038B56219
MAIYNTHMLRPSRFKAGWNLLQKHHLQKQTRMWRVSVIWVLCFACVWAGLPGKDSIAQNYEACHGNTHGMTVTTAESCDSTLRYRSVDGTCNNLNNPSWGSNGQNFLCLLDPVYDDDGLPGEDSISQNYEACHGKTYGMTESCDSTLRYRSVDGTCNNLNNPSWGSSGQNFLRLLDPVYDDGLPGEDSISQNYEACHSNTHGMTANPNNKRSVPKVDEPSLDRARRQAESCDSTLRYRSVDGTCNNLNNPSWGSNGQNFLRLLDPVYDDGAQSPRQKKMNNDALPSPRDVSTSAHDFDRNRLSQHTSVMLMEWGQFLAHDMSATPVDSNSMTSDTCCSESLVTTGELHSDVNSGGPCFPIIISENDRHFTDVAHRCMEFVRSFPVTENNVRQQVNLHSAFVDGTNVYGFSDTEMAALRDTTGGKLLVERDNYLPESDTNFCVKDSDDDYCLQAGDSRVNVYPGLGALHTIFMRYHNYVAGELETNNPTWTNDDLFNYARKIVIAVLQHITFDEYLPAVLGRTTLAEYGISSDFAYDDSCDATLYNVFSTAAFRFGHSMVPDGLLIDGQVVESLDLFLRPHSVLTSLDSLVSGLASSRAEEVDRWYSEGMTDHLFEEAPFEGFDVAALNIQRGRDHGLPSYNDWRVKCGLDRVASFTELPLHAQRRYETVYGDTDNIDLYSGALTETRVSGGIVGPTYACLLGQQFANLRKCDRFFWETTDPVTGFDTDRQRMQIQRTKLSHVICRTTGITSIQDRVFDVPDSRRNPEKTCASILAKEMDLGLF